jgi:hypothetical protein
MMEWAETKRPPIKLEFSAPYVKEEDRKNTVKVMTNMTTSMLLWAHLPKVFWNYAIMEYAVEIKNRV